MFNIGTHQRGAVENSGPRPARLNGADGGALREPMKPSEMAVMEGEHGGNESETLSGTGRRRDLPVCFRCGKCWLPVDSIRASSERKGERKERK